MKNNTIHKFALWLTTATSLVALASPLHAMPLGNGISNAPPVQTQSAQGARDQVVSPLQKMRKKIEHFGKLCSPQLIDAPGCRVWANDLAGALVGDTEDLFSAHKLTLVVLKEMNQVKKNQSNAYVAPPRFYNEAIYNALTRSLQTWGQGKITWQGGKPEIANPRVTYQHLMQYLIQYVELYFAINANDVSQSPPSVLISYRTRADLTRMIVHLSLMRDYIAEKLGSGTPKIKLPDDFDNAIAHARKNVGQFAPGSHLLLALAALKRKADHQAALEMLRDSADQGDVLAKIERAKLTMKQNRELSGQDYAEAMNAISSHNDVDSDRTEDEEDSASTGGRGLRFMSAHDTNYDYNEGKEGGFEQTSSRRPASAPHQNRAFSQQEFATANYSFQKARLQDLESFMEDEQRKAAIGQPDFFWHFTMASEHLIEFRKYWEHLVAQYYADFKTKLDKVTNYYRDTQVPFERRKEVAEEFYLHYKDAMVDVTEDPSADGELKKKVQDFMRYEKSLKNGTDGAYTANAITNGVATLLGSAAVRATPLRENAQWSRSQLDQRIQGLDGGQPPAPPPPPPRRAKDDSDL